MFTVVVTVIAALVAAAAAGIAAPSILGRNLASLELVGVALGFGLLGWGLTRSLQRRERKRMLEMRDSALW